MPSLLPQRLSHQIALAVSLLFALTVLLYTAYTVYEQSAMGEQAIVRQGAVLARGVAAMSAGTMLNDSVKLEAILAQVASDKDLRSLHVVDPKGLVIAGVRKAAAGGPALDKLLNQVFTPPANGVLQAPVAHGLVIWQQIAGQSGWIRLEVGFDGLAEIRSHIWQDSLIAAVLAIVLAVSVLLLLLARPMRVLTRASEFAAGLDVRRGEVLPDYRGNQEISGLVAALNQIGRASCRERV